MKHKPNRLGMYQDVRDILDAARSAGGGTYECSTHGQAVHWRQRAYKFRKLYAELLGPNESSPYDQMVLPRVDVDSSTVIIAIRRQIGKFTPNDEPTDDLLVGDDLLDEALEIAKRIGD